MSNTNATIRMYTSDAFCPQCLVARRRLTDKGIPFDEQTANDEIREKLRSEGYQSFPVIQLIDNMSEEVKDTVIGSDIKGIDQMAEIYEAYGEIA